MLAIFKNSTSTRQISRLRRASAQTHIRLSRNRSLGLSPISHHRIRTISTVFKGAAQATLLRRSRSPYLHSTSNSVTRLTFYQKRMEIRTLLKIIKIFYPHQRAHLLMRRIGVLRSHIHTLRQIRLRLPYRPCSIPMKWAMVPLTLRVEVTCQP
jgi:hypothetical protein